MFTSPCLQGTFTALGFTGDPVEQLRKVCAANCTQVQVPGGLDISLVCCGQLSLSSVGNRSLSLCIYGACGKCVFDIQTSVIALLQKPVALVNSCITKTGKKYLCSPLLPPCALR